MEFQYKLLNLQESLMRFAYRLTPDKDYAKELVQETYLRALKYRDKFKPESNFKAWTYTIMKNNFINNYRRSVLHKMYNDQTKEGFSLNYTNASGCYTPDSVYASKELERLIDALDEDFKLPLKMHYEGFRYKEIAETLNMKLGTVKSRIFLARKKLTVHLNG